MCRSAQATVPVPILQTQNGVSCSKTRSSTWDQNSYSGPDGGWGWGEERHLVLILMLDIQPIYTCVTQ